MMGYGMSRGTRPSDFGKILRGAVWGAVGALIFSASTHESARAQGSISRAPNQASQTSVAKEQTASQDGSTTAAKTPKAAAPIDLTGYWVSLVTRDWRFRMVVPGRGEYQGVPLSLKGKEFADAWDMKLDEKMGKQCAAYGAGAIMLVPTRLHIDWQDDDTLRVQTDAGMQTRLLHFGGEEDSAAPLAASWQGYSRASWTLHRTGVLFAALPDPIDSDLGSLKIITDRMLPGLLRKNGMGYSDRSVLTEHWELQKDPVTNKEYLIVSASLDDPVFLTTSYFYTATFEREADKSKWNPTPCSLSTSP